MENKKTWKLLGLLFLGLLLAGAIIWGIFTKAAQKELSETLNKTTSIAKIKLHDYDNYTANDRVKSLVRLLDKSKEFSSNLNKIAHYGQKDINEYVTEQRLSGVFAVDANRNITLQSIHSGDLDAQSLWKQIIEKDYIGAFL